MDPASTIGLVTLVSFLKDCVKSATIKHTVGGAEAASQRLIEIIKETLNGTSLPKNHNLLHAIENSLGQAASAFACAVAQQVDKKPSWAGAIRAHYQNGTLGKIPLVEMRDCPERDWVAELLKESKGGRGTRAVSADFLLDEGLVTELLLKDANAELKRRVNDAFSVWLERRVQHGKRPACVAELLENGWPLEPGKAQLVTFYQAFCAFFAEKLKDDSKVESIFLAQTLSQLAHEMKALKNLQAPTLAEFRSWLEGPLAEVLALLRSIKDDTTVLLADTAELKSSGAEILSEAKKTNAMLEEVLQTARLYKHGDFHQLPSLKDKFTGRGEELARLCADVRQRRQSHPHSAIVTVIHGPGGVGKTEFAVAAGYALLADCPDSQLVLRLSAHSTRAPDAREVRDSLLQLPNPHPDEPLPTDEHVLAERYRRLFRPERGEPKRSLLILDDVADEQQINLLLPPPGCVVLVTARKPLASGEQFPLRKLPSADAMRLLQRFRPAPGLPNAIAAELARLCGYLPVTLTVAGGFLQTRASKPVAEYIGELKADPLGRLRHEDEALDINVIFARSLRDLSAAQQSAFAALSVMSADFDRATGVAVGDCNGDELDEIVRLHLLEYEDRTARFEWHDLTREFAFQDLHEPARQAARLRHAVHFAQLLQRHRLSLEVVSRERHHFRAASRFIIKHHQVLLENGTPLRLLTAIQSWLLPAQTMMAGPPCNEKHRGTPPIGGGYFQLLEWSQRQVSLARKEGDRKKEANALWNVAVFFWHLGKRANAFEVAEAALRLFESFDAQNAVTARAELSRWKKHNELTVHALRSR